MISKKISKKPKSKSYWRFEIVALGTISLLSLLIAIVWQNQPPIPPQVIDFSWEGRMVGVRDRYFTLTFNRPVDRANIEQNLQIQPALPGKVSWVGQKLFYTLLELPVYGVTYQLKLEGVKELKFESQFSTRDLAWAYIGVKEQEKGKLILYNLNRNQKTILTPANLIVSNFEIYPDGDKILFSAFDRNKKVKVALPQLYSVATGINPKSDGTRQAGKIEQIWDGNDSPRLYFDLSADAKVIVLQKRDPQKPSESSLWILSNSGKPRPLGISGNKFMISPDSRTLAVVQPQGVTIVPLYLNDEVREFFTGYDDILGFFSDGSQKVMVKTDKDAISSLSLVNVDGEERELFRTEGSILECQFEPRWEHTLYCLTTDLLPEKEGLEEPSLTAIDLETAQNFPLLALPNHKDVRIGISPDGFSLLFDQIVIDTSETKELLQTDDGRAIAAGLLWLLRIPDLQTANRSNIVPPTELFPGFKPQWFP